MTVLEIVGIAAAGVAFVTGVLALSRSAWRGMRRIMHVVDDLAGSPARDGVEARPGIMARMTTLETQVGSIRPQVEVIHHEVLPNEGTSLRDEVTRNTERLADHANRLTRIEQRLPEEN
ncbi:hypothetical protein [Phytoactinopolyspora limicola]|uniref:hypothetical protein n=1 Tax=Phytoactinopolyspora limicola TaxID=2715536 RepID=UPI00140BAC17|nr:hypothetical protein [Phytoactinopolyspora limicola]